MLKLTRYHPTTTSRLNPFLCAIGLLCVCCLLVFKLFSFYQAIRLLSRKTVNKYLYKTLTTKNDKTYSVFQCLYELVVLLFFIDMQLIHHLAFR